MLLTPHLPDARAVADKSPHAACCCPCPNPLPAAPTTPPTAGIVAGQTTGVAKKANIISVRVLDEMGSGTIATLVDGMNHVANSNLTNRIASMSLGGGKAEALNEAVEAAVKAGVLVIVAAGNEASPACDVSPGEPRSSAPCSKFPGQSAQQDGPSDPARAGRLCQPSCG